jgi:hypothetical protein
MLNRALERVSRLAVHDYLVAIASDFDGLDKDSRRLILQMAQHNDVLAAQVYDPLATHFPEGGRFVVSQGELQLELDLGKSRVREPLTEYLDDRLKTVSTMLKDIGIPVLPIDTEADVLEQIRRAFGHVPGR